MLTFRSKWLYSVCLRAIFIYIYIYACLSLSLLLCVYLCLLYSFLFYCPSIRYMLPYNTIVLRYVINTYVCRADEYGSSSICIQTNSFSIRKLTRIHTTILLGMPVYVYAYNGHITELPTIHYQLNCALSRLLCAVQSVSLAVYLYTTFFVCPMLGRSKKHEHI